ncbi:MAG: lauroyl acyltransferase [Alphaproteobacteria bacterium]|nr:lauroyl acyltransferase [Alphaproteobacteria bacterium]
MGDAVPDSGPDRKYRARALVINYAEAWSAAVLLWLCARLPLSVASGIGGAVARTIGPYTARSRIAVRNLARAFPDKSPQEVRAILRAMWDHVGRLALESAHLRAIDCYAPDSPVEVVGAEHIDAVKASGRGAIFFAGHIGQWDIPPMAVQQRGVDATIIYREINNPVLNRVMAYWRAPMGAFKNKGRSAAKTLIEGLREGRHFAMLVDQKMNDGIAVPFFGRPAMTAPAIAQFAVRDDIPIVPARCERLGGTRFRVTFYPPLEVSLTGDRARDVATTMERVNALLESWIREHPEQWLWVHRRWPD